CTANDTNSPKDTPYKIDSSNANQICMGGTTSTTPGCTNPSNNLCWNGGMGPTNTTSGGYVISSQYPNGYKAFYLMKYEISQEQFKDFFNTLTYTQQRNHTPTAPVANNYVMTSTNTSAYRNGLRYPSLVIANEPVTIGCDLNNTDPMNQSTDGQWIAA